MVVRAEGAYLYDADKNRYLDLFGSWGPMLLGHAFGPVVTAVKRAAEHGTSFGANTPSESDLAELVQRCFPSMERMRFVSSGTEACMSAIRLARGFTGRPFVIKFEGCYHGHADALLVKAGRWPQRVGESLHCANCEYILVDNPAKCPECGRDTSRNVVRGARAHLHKNGTT